MNAKKMVTLGMMTALYVVLSAFLKFTLIGNIMIDFGYIVFAFSLCMFGISGTIVGVMGCALESILFSAYGFSISWCAANLVIGLMCGAFLHRNKHTVAKMLMIIAGVAVGMLAVKTAIECYLYSIPLAVKIPKNAVAFCTDTVTMIAGLLFYNAVHERLVTDKEAA